MNNKLLNAMKTEANVIRTENGGVAYKSTFNAIQDLFALGGSYRTRSDEDVILLFKKAFEEDNVLALKCLFYLRDIRGGQGERRFFRTVIKWLAKNHTEAIRRNLKFIPEFGRWDDLYEFVGTPLEKDAFKFMYDQLALDVACKTPSLLAKWLKSTNTSSRESCRLGNATRIAFGMTAKQYRKTLSILRNRIKVVEKLMSEGRWDEIEFDKLPSKAGIIYKNAFARKDLIKEKYTAFATDSKTKVNAKTLNPCEVVREVTNHLSYWGSTMSSFSDVERAMINKYWDNLKDYFNGATFDGVAVVDTSASMCGRGGNVAPIDVAISLGLYCAEKCAPTSPWFGHYISFSRNARLVPVEGIDFVDKVYRIYRKNLCENTNIKSVFDLLLDTALKNHIPAAEMPKNVVIISDMEFDYCSEMGRTYKSEMEKIMAIWKSYGYEAPHLIFWNVDARQDNIPMRDNGYVTFVSGYSPVIYEMLMTGKTGLDLVLDKLNSERYACIR